MAAARLDEIGNWSEVKLDIIREYAKAYSTVVNAQKGLRRHIYIDAFAGSGVHVSKRTGHYVPGSPLNALLVQPPFREFHLIDMDGDKAQALRKLTAGRNDVLVYEGDCNQILLEKVFPHARYEDYRRALCLLDPYGLHLNWEIIQTAGQMRSIEIFLNFPVMDMNMNVLLWNPDKIQKGQAQRMNAFWGDRTWRDVGYKKRPLIPDLEDKASNEKVAQAYRERLRDVAGFKFVPEPIPMRNSKGAVLYYLFFASPNPTGAKIVGDIFDKYRGKEA